MKSLYKNRAITFPMLVFILAAGCFMTSVPFSCFADDSPAAIREIRRPPGFNSGEINFEDLERRTFYARGTLDAVNDKAICVGDKQIDLAPNAKVNCKVGMYVGIKINDEGKAVSCEPLARSRR